MKLSEVLDTELEEGAKRQYKRVGGEIKKKYRWYQRED